MKIDAILPGSPDSAAEGARRCERLGLDGIMVPEVAHDPFVALAVAAAATSRVQLTSGIAVAFARNPMTVAVTGSDLHRLSGGRFALGLGTQIKPHITRRFSMPWSSPAPRMREFVAAVRAIWAAWQDGAPLDFRGEFYQHTLMTPMFSHGPSEFGTPAIYLAGVGPVLTALAGEIADGFIAHGFTTPEYFAAVTAPQLDLGLARAGRSRADFEATVPVMAAFADSDTDDSVAALRATIAFYGSTPAYRPVLAHHGWTEVGEELHRLSKHGDWATMATLIDDDILHTFAVIGDPTTVARDVRKRYTGLADRLQIGVNGDEQAIAEMVAALRSPA